ncbi:MAG: hypothetical protein ACFE8N_05685 [Promethearchaeota archaeon]
MIINNAGIALFYHNFINNEKRDDHQSLASYFDIICRFTKHNFKESLRILTLDSFLFYFYTHRSNYHLVLKCDNKRLNKDLFENIAKTIIDNFLNEYEALLKQFHGEISSFNSFSQIVKNIIALKLGDLKDIIPLEH